MQSKLGPEPGYLPERDAQILLVGVSLSLYYSVGLSSILTAFTA